MSRARRLALPAILLLAAAAAGQDAAIAFGHDLAAAQEAAARDGRPVIAYFTYET